MASRDIAPLQMGVSASHHRWSMDISRANSRTDRRGFDRSSKEIPRNPRRPAPDRGRCARPTVVLVAAAAEQGGNFKGSDLIQLNVNANTIERRLYPVVTNLAEMESDGEGEKTTRKVIGGAGLGALI